jgi:hypothetical protein
VGQVFRVAAPAWSPSHSPSWRSPRPTAAGAAKVMLRIGTGRTGVIHAGEWIVEEPTTVYGSADRADVSFGLSYTEQVSVYRILVLVLPGVAGMIAYVVCRQLQAGDEVARDRRLAEAEARLARLRRRASPPASG